LRWLICLKSLFCRLLLEFYFFIDQIEFVGREKTIKWTQKNQIHHHHYHPMILFLNLKKMRVKKRRNRRKRRLRLMPTLQPNWSPIHFHISLSSYLKSTPSIIHSPLVITSSTSILQQVSILVIWLIVISSSKLVRLEIYFKPKRW